MDNARAFLRIQEEFGSFDAYLWGFAPGAPLRRAPGAPVPAQTPLSQEISRDLRRRGMKFVGPVIVYSFLQSVGVVNDHELACFCHPGNWTIPKNNNEVPSMEPR